MTRHISNTDRIARVRWSSSDLADRFAVEDPATGEVIATVHGGGAAEVDAAVITAHRAFQRDWRSRPQQDRSRLMLKCADAIEQNADQLAELESLENGKPLADARLHDVGALIGTLRFFGSLVDKLPTEFYDKGPIYTCVLREPLGVDVGGVFVNNYNRALLGAPFGGTKHSGFGRESAIETLHEFTYAKVIRFPSGVGSIPSWRGVTDAFRG